VGYIVVKVILLKDIKHQGKAGDIVSVSDGYGKNYLLPNKLAVIATNEALKINQNVKDKQTEIKKTQLQNYQVIKTQLENLTLEFKLKTINDKVAGAISAKQICEHLAQAYQINLDKHKFLKFNPINKLGVTVITIKLDPTIVVQLKVKVLGA